MPSAFRDQLERDRRLGVSVREYRELVEREAWPSYAVWERIAKFSGWPETYLGPA